MKLIYKTLKNSKLIKYSSFITVNSFINKYLSKYYLKTLMEKIEENNIKNENPKENVKDNNEKTGKKEKEKKIDRAKVKAAKGTRDFGPLQMVIRNKIFSTITSVFKKHGAEEIDTPVFELKETLTGKYGEDSKLIYDLNDQGGELLALRYDLTVPFARYMAMNGTPSIKRYHIGKVYRRDEPGKGRFREFYQCDFDIVGNNYGKMIPDSETLKVAIEILLKLDIGSFLIKVNNRKILDAMIEVAGISNDLFKTVCSSVDKLDKTPWSEVRKELLTKGLKEEQCDKLWEYCQLKGSPKEMVEILDSKDIKNSPKAKEALEEMKLLFEYTDALNISQYLSYDLSLARGLDYYTGIIYEGILIGQGVGSICGGGRYDELIGMFSSKALPSVGISIGVERIFSIIEEKLSKDKTVRPIETEVLVASVGKKNLSIERLKILNELWSEGIKAEMLYQETPRMDKQMDFATDNKIPIIIFIGESEIEKNIVKIKTLANKQEKETSRDNFISEIKSILSDSNLIYY